MALASINSNVTQLGTCQMFLFPYPTTAPLRTASPPGSPTYADYVEGYRQLVFLDPTINTTLNTGVKEYALLEASGFQLTVKANTPQAKPNNGPPFPAGIAYFDAMAEIQIYDVDVEHLKDVFNAVGADTVTIAAGGAASGKESRKHVAFGPQSQLAKLTCILRKPSPQYANQYDLWILPRVTISPDSKFEYALDKVVAAKIKLDCQADPYLDPLGNGRYAVGVFDQATSVAP